MLYVARKFRYSIFVVIQVYKVKVEHCGHWGVSQIPNWFIYRRYNDFADLHRQLIKHFPESGLGLPPKRWIGNNYDPVFIGHRIEGFNTFLKQILETSLTEIRDSSLVRDFLCLDSPPNRASSLSSCRVSLWLSFCVLTYFVHVHSALYNYSCFANVTIICPNVQIFANIW